MSRRNNNNLGQRQPHQTPILHNEPSNIPQQEEEHEEDVQDDEQQHYHEIIVDEDGNQLQVEEEESMEQDDQDKELDVTETYGQDMIGQVVQGEDGELYLLAAEDDDETNPSHHHEGIMDINSVQEVKIMSDNNSTSNSTTQLVYYTSATSDKDHHHQPRNSLSTATSSSGRAIINKNNPIYPQGMKGRRNRVYGHCKCPECGQSFVNTARLERHLAVHQIFGNFTCPLCTKTYKYEYNLFYHWRKTCRDLDDVCSVTERKGMDVNTLRQAVEDLVRKKEHYGPISVGISHHALYRNNHYDKIVLPAVRRSLPCRACGVSIPLSHMQRHLDLHRGLEAVDESDAGSYFCDLCGLMFRQHHSLIKHWRNACPEVQANLPPDVEHIDDQNLKMLVSDLLQSVVVVSDFREPQIPREMNLREKARQYDSTTDDLNFPSTNQVEDELHPHHQHEAGGGGEHDEFAQGEPVVFADDIVDDDGGSSTLTSHNRNKWVNSGMPVQCHECKRAFANAGRLERHMAGFHSSTGSHHCPLCGNRFKYDYNLLYHYRRSCPYTKSFIETDMRQQLDAQTLRKLVRSLAAKDLRVAHPELVPNIRQKEEYGDTYVRREMLGKPEMMRNLPQIPPNRAGLPDGKSCPLCGIVFYGNKVLERHVYAVHPEDHPYFDPDQCVMREITEEEMMEDPNAKNDHALDQSYDDDGADGGPPELEKEADEVEGPLQIIDEHGNLISEVRDYDEIQELVSTGQLGLRETDRFVRLSNFE